MAVLPQTDAELRKLSYEQLKEILDGLEAAEREKKFNALKYFKPYPKQREFMALGKTKLERLLMAGNRVGKTFCGAAEMAYHLTGQYPKWWKGRRFNRAIKAWAANDTGLNTRDIVQTKLCGPYGVKALQGAGAIPRDAVNWEGDDVSLARGVADAYDTVLVDHVCGDKSILTFKSYEQGRKKWQGDTIDVIWYDEEPPAEIYSEGTARLAPTSPGEPRGIEYTTFTPLEGKTDVVLMFLEEDSPDRGVVYMTIEDAEHIGAVEREQTIRSYRPHEREARSKGTPLMGEGRVFQSPEAAITEDALVAPAHWPKLWSIDFGGGTETGHPFAAVLQAWDRDADVVHVLHAFRMKEGRPLDHAKAMKPFGLDIPVAWPRDGKNQEIGSGKPLSKYYKDEGLRVLSDHAQWPDGSVSTEAGVQEMDDRMTTARYKVAAHLKDWFEEYRNYYRKNGKLVKIRDDLMSASRVGVMALRFARVAGSGSYGARNASSGSVARGVESEMWGA